MFFVCLIHGFFHLQITTTNNTHLSLEAVVVARASFTGLIPLPTPVTTVTKLTSISPTHNINPERQSPINFEQPPNHTGETVCKSPQGDGGGSLGGCGGSVANSFTQSVSKSGSVVSSVALVPHQTSKPQVIFLLFSTIDDVVVVFIANTSPLIGFHKVVQS